MRKLFIIVACLLLLPLITAHTQNTGALSPEVREFVKTRLSAHEYPREVAFISEMPMTTTGKVIRRLLRERA